MGESGSSCCLNVKLIRASPRLDSPSEAIQIVLSFVARIPSSVVLISLACSSPDSCLQEPEIRTGRALYTRLSEVSIPSAPTVA
jgi:hypothetical protein